MRVFCTVLFVVLADLPAQDAKREIAPVVGEVKTVHMVGEVKVSELTFTGHMTVFEVMTRARPTTSADLERIVVVRADGGVLAVAIDFKQMITTGSMKYNIRLNADDWLVVLPQAKGERSPAAEEAFDTLLRSSAPERTKATILAHRLMHGDEIALRARAATEMGALGEAGVLVVDPLITALKDTKAVRREAIMALGMLGAKAAAACDALEALTHDGDGQVARRAKAALTTIRAAVAAEQAKSPRALGDAESRATAPSSRASGDRKQ